MNFRREHSLGKDEARRRVDDVAASIASTYGLSSAWRGDALNISGSGVNGRIAVDERNIDVNVKLGFALKLLEGTIRKSIEDALDKHLA